MPVTTTTDAAIDTATIARIRETLHGFAGKGGFADLPDAAPITQGSPMARRQISAGDVRNAIGTLGIAAARLESGDDSIEVRAQIRAALAPFADFAGGGGFRHAPGEMQITRGTPGRGLKVDDFRAIAALHDTMVMS
jgi:hypothetical protein